ncbi:MAG: DUF4349 domain-containing protein [Anaerolineae bacterium]
MKKIALLWVLSLVAVVGCGARGAPAPAEAPRPPAVGLGETLIEVAPGAPEEDLARDAAAPLTQEPDRMVIRTAQIEIEVEDAETSLARLEALASQYGGYVSDSRTFRDHNDQIHAFLTLRVPAADFEAVRDAIKEEGLEVLSENTDAADVTEQFTDLESRLRNLELAEEELRQLLAGARERGEDTEDVLAIYRLLTEYRGQIEQIQGRMRFLSDQVGLATFSVTLTPQEVEAPIVEPEWSFLRIVRDAFRDLFSGLRVLAEVATRFVISALPLLIIISLPFAAVAWGFRLAWLRRRASKAEAAIPDSE